MFTESHLNPGALWNYSLNCVSLTITKSETFLEGWRENLFFLCLVSSRIRKPSKQCNNLQLKISTVTEGDEPGSFVDDVSNQARDNADGASETDVIDKVAHAQRTSTGCIEPEVEHVDDNKYLGDSIRKKFNNNVNNKVKLPNT